MVNDLYAYFKLPPNSIGLFECFLSNVVGGAIFAFVYLSISYVCQILPKVATEYFGVARFFSAIGPAALAIAVLLIQYYVLALFFNPVPSYVEAKVAADATLGILYDDSVKKRLAEEAEKCRCEPAKKDKRNFNFLSGAFEGGFSIVGQGENSNLVWNPGSGKKIEVTLSAYDGCYPSEGVKFPIVDKRVLVFNDVESFQIKLPASMVGVKTALKQGSLEFNETTYSPIWLKKDNKKFALTRFLGGGQVVDYWVNNSDIDLDFEIPLLDLSKKKIATPELKVVTIVQNGKSTLLNLLPPNNLLGVKGCYAAPIKNKDAGTAYIDSLASVITLRLKIKVVRSPTELYYDKRDYFSINGVSGWYSVSDVAAEGVKDLAKSGVVQGVSIFKGLRYLNLNGKSVEELENRVFTFYNSDLNMELNDDGTLILKGESKLVWIDEKRLSPTRWESMDGATQGILLGLAGTLILGFFMLLRSMWKTNPSLIS